MKYLKKYILSCITFTSCINNTFSNAMEDDSEKNDKFPSGFYTANGNLDMYEKEVKFLSNKPNLQQFIKNLNRLRDLYYDIDSKIIPSIMVYDHQNPILNVLMKKFKFDLEKLNTYDKEIIFEYFELFAKVCEFKLDKVTKELDSRHYAQVIFQYLNSLEVDLKNIAKIKKNKNYDDKELLYEYINAFHLNHSSTNIKNINLYPALVLTSGKYYDESICFVPYNYGKIAQICEIMYKAQDNELDWKRGELEGMQDLLTFSKIRAYVLNLQKSTLNSENECAILALLLEKHKEHGGTRDQFIKTIVADPGDAIAKVLEEAVQQLYEKFKRLEIAKKLTLQKSNSMRF